MRLFGTRFGRKHGLRDAANAIADAVFTAKDQERIALEEKLVAEREAEDRARDKLVSAIDRSLQANVLRKRSLGFMFGDAAASSIKIMIDGLGDDINGKKD